MTMKRTRFELEEMMKDLTGGTSPEHRSIPIFDKQAGWQFITFGASVVDVITGEDPDIDPEDPVIGDPSHNHDARYYTKSEIDAMFEALEPGGGGSGDADEALVYTFALMGAS